MELTRTLKSNIEEVWGIVSNNEAYIPDDMSTIADKIGKWYNSPTGTYPDIDKYALDFMGE